VSVDNAESFGGHQGRKLQQFSNTSSHKSSLCNRRRGTQAIGALSARMLHGAWRLQPPPLDLSAAELNEVVYPLIASGAGALAYRRIRSSPFENTPGGELLRDAYRRHSLQAAIHHKSLQYLFGSLNDAKINAVLVKGWAAARLYPEPGLRPYGDFDLCIPPGDYIRACEFIRMLDRRKFNADLHRGLMSLDLFEDQPLNDNVKTVRLGDVTLQVLTEETHLRILCTHALRHGFWKPIWLCDIAAAIESRSKGFDWNLCLGDNPVRSEWIVCTIGLASVLLGACIEDTPVAGRASRLPRWLAPSVLKQWAQPYVEVNETPELMLTQFRRGTSVTRELRRRWPNPIKASTYFRARFNNFPRLPLQLSYAGLLFAKFLGRLPGQLNG